MDSFKIIGEFVSFCVFFFFEIKYLEKTLYKNKFEIENVHQSYY